MMPQKVDIEVSVTPDAILAVATGFMAAKHLFVASEIGLFSAWPMDAHLPLAGPASLIAAQAS